MFDIGQGEPTLTHSSHTQNEAPTNERKLFNPNELNLHPHPGSRLPVLFTDTPPRTPLLRGVKGTREGVKVVYGSGSTGHRREGRRHKRDESDGSSEELREVGTPVGLYVSIMVKETQDETHHRGDLTRDPTVGDGLPYPLSIWVSSSRTI